MRYNFINNKSHQKKIKLQIKNPVTKFENGKYIKSNHIEFIDANNVETQ